MNWPPLLMHIKVKNEANDFGIWIPIILLILIAFAVIIAFSPLILLALIIMSMVGWGRWARLTVLALWAALVAVWSLRGLEVDVQEPGEHIRVSVI